MSVKLKGGTISMQYKLPIASDQTLGGVKIGNGLSIDANGVLTVVVPGVTPGYIKNGATALSSGWLEDEKGVAIVPKKNSLYVIMSEGTYKYRIYVYDNGYHSITGGGGGSPDDVEPIPLEDLEILFT